MDRPNKKYVVRLDGEEREGLRRLVSKGKASALKLTRAHILLQTDVSKAGPGWTDEQIAEGLGIAVRTVEHVRRRFVEEGLERVLERKKRCRPSVERKLDGRKEARLIAVCCSQAPPGRRRWTLRLLADRLMELNVVDSISHETVRQTLKKAGLSSTDQGTPGRALSTC